MSQDRKKKGLIIVNTGDGKGKTSAALGVALRALGHDFSVSIVQFIKSKWRPGEVRIAPLLKNYEIERTGEGFTWLSKDLERDKAKAQKGWDLAKEKLSSDKYELLILDEITYAINYHFIELQDVLEALKNKPEMLHVIITGRNAPKEMIDIADLVTEMRLVKHPYKDGIVAQRGIEF
ncbi:MAG: cob(I)yrinic acid a,c-diamide adenosyltransferase [Nitrososphaerales archaeon]